MRFRDKVVVVTGSSAGIGAASARRFASEGASIVINGRREAPLRQLFATLDEPRVLMHAGDVSIEKDAKALIAAAVERFGRIDVLVNNASSVCFADVEAQTTADWHQTFATNVDAAFWTAQAALPHLQSGSSLVNVSSVSALGGDLMFSAYNAAKAALSNYTRALAVELGPRGVRVNAVLPSIAWTDRTAVMRDATEMTDRQLARIPLGRFAEADEVAAAIAFLASDDASFVTGAELAVDGGLRAGSGLAPFL